MLQLGCIVLLHTNTYNAICTGTILYFKLVSMCLCEWNACFEISDIKCLGR